VSRLCLLAVAALGCRSTAPAPAAAPVDRGYLKGQLHVHSSNSGDSETPPDQVARWYRAHGFDFIVFTDHNRITTLGDTDGLLVFPGVELTQNLETCEPPPPAPGLGCLLHVNALFVTETSSPAIRWTPPPGVPRRLDLYANALDETQRLGGLAQLDHPNFHWGADAVLVAELVHRGLALFEVANQSSDVANEGDADHPSTEALWDSVLTAGGILYGVATDDAHHYDDADAVRARGVTPDTGDHGWVMVHATRDHSAIRDAVMRGDFYSSTGVVLDRIERTTDALVIAGADGEYDFAFIGLGGRVLARSHGRAATFPLGSARGGYVRATVTDARGRRAWVQPIRVPG
jgi:hypothetical protein